MNNKFSEKDICRRVVLTDNYDGLSEGSTGLITKVSDYGIEINYIDGYITNYCEDCNSYDCGCYDDEEWEYDHTEHETFYIANDFVKLVESYWYKTNLSISHLTQDLIRLTDWTVSVQENSQNKDLILLLL